MKKRKDKKEEEEEKTRRRNEKNEKNNSSLEYQNADEMIFTTQGDNFCGLNCMRCRCSCCYCCSKVKRNRTVSLLTTIEQ